jgi:membrane protease YdiL (CAAX protease family)
VRVAAPSLTPAAAGLGFLLLRPGLEGLGPGARSAVLATGYLSLAAGAGGVLGRGRGRLRTARGATGSPRPAPLPAWATLAVGLLAVVAAARMAGPAPPLASGAATLTLGLLAAVAEEALFRGALYAWIERSAAAAAGRRRGGGSWGTALPPALAVVVSAVAFALMHLPSYGPSALPVDLGAGLLLGWQRWASGHWTVPAATHAVANLLAVILP